MAAALASINQKLAAIQATQQEMFEYARKKDESEMKGDLKFLIETFNNYKNAWNNDLFVQSSHNQALTCKRHADYSGPLRATCPEFESHHSGE